MRAHLETLAALAFFGALLLYVLSLVIFGLSVAAPVAVQESATSVAGQVL